MKKEMRALGVKIKEVKVDIDQLIRYCQLRGVANNGESRAQFVQEKLNGKIR